MKCLKFTILLIIILSFKVSQAQVDEPVSIRINMGDNSFKLKKSADGVSESTDTVLNNLIKSKKNFSMRQTFPYSKYPELLNLYTINCFAQDTVDILNRLKKAKSVSKIMKMPKPKSMYEPSDWYYSSKKDECWHLDKIECPKAWDITKGDEGATLAIIDTKFDYEHPDLHNKFIVDYDPYTGIKHTQVTASGTDAHGTAVAGTAIAQTDGGGLLASVGFDAKFYAYTWDNGVAKAQQAALDLGVDVISISWFSSCSYNYYDALAIKEIIDNGTIVVAAAGNGATQCSGGETCPFCSLNDDRVIVVSTTGRDDRHTIVHDDGTDVTDSQYPGVDICAPGVDIPVAIPTGGTTWPYFGFSGHTSIATPMVAATCVLMRDVNRCISPEAVDDVLKETADPITDANLYPGQVGAGRLNVYHAVLGAIDRGTNHIDNQYLGGNYNINGLYVAFKNTILSTSANVAITYEKEVTLEAGFEVDLGGQLSISQGTYTCP